MIQENDQYMKSLKHNFIQVYTQVKDFFKMVLFSVAHPVHVKKGRCNVTQAVSDDGSTGRSSNGSRIWIDPWH